MLISVGNLFVSQVEFEYFYVKFVILYCLIKLSLNNLLQ